MRLTLITGNPGKLEEARRLLGPVPGLALDAVALELPELQSLDLDAVLRAKGEEAFRRLGRPVVVDDTALELAALGGFPGPLVKWMLEALGAAGIARTASALGDPRATARCAILFRDGERELVGRGAVEGTLVEPPRGDGGFGWDPIFQPLGQPHTYAELAPDLKDRLGHRGQAWRDLLGKLGATPG